MLQAQKKFWGKRPGLDFGDIIHFSVNAAFVLVLFLMVRSWSVPFLAGVLVILSKWRVFAVQPRFWLPNIKANLVDTIVGLSTVMLMNQSASNGIAFFWALLFIIWVLYIKPRGNDLMVGIQALWAQFIGILTILLTTSLLEYSFVGVLLVWVVAWAAARHFLANYEEPHYKTLSLVWAFLVMQLAWMGFHWISYYRLLPVNISNVSLLVSVVAGTLGLLYHAFRTDKLQKSVVLENTIFGAVLVLIILLTSSWTTQL